MNKHKRFIKEAYEGKHGSICRKLKDTILKHYPEFHEKGWYKSELSKCFAFVDGLVDDGDFVGFGFLDNGKWIGLSDGWTSHFHTHWTKATKEEILSHLSKEADNRGYDFGVSCKSLLSGDIVTLTNNGTSYIPETDELHVKNCLVYKKGQWADKIKTITKEEAEKKLGVKII